MNKSLKEKAISLFEKANYNEAILQFSLFLKDNNEDKEARLGVLLCDLALENEKQAIILYKYYQTLKVKVNNAQEVMLNIIDTLDDNMEILNKYVARNTNENLLLADAIFYEDFKNLIESRGSFKEAFEDLIFSTKVVIDSKNDFKDFISNLIDNHYYDMSYSYLEIAISAFPYEHSFKSLFSKLQEQDKGQK